ncbi:hypothetical protein L2E82_40413 [Cichorium intybus]|uniref:Uncharacterized protein n=1 Tax=Cichorium intybus TaxID=13427 RepID=A0ACB9ALW4_CICIN|nr:hypothetical protein L2E82_40413 [Cichorium intybus]
MAALPIDASRFDPDSIQNRIRILTLPPPLPPARYAPHPLPLSSHFLLYSLSSRFTSVTPVTQPPPLIPLLSPPSVTYMGGGAPPPLKFPSLFSLPGPSQTYFGPRAVPGSPSYDLSPLPPSSAVREPTTIGDSLPALPKPSFPHHRWSHTSTIVLSLTPKNHASPFLDLHD